MKVEVLKVFFDNNGLHRVGEIVEVENINENLMKPIEAEKKTVAPKATKKTTKR